MTGPAPGRDRHPIAYLTGTYPLVSHTFILREIEALRARGRVILTCSIRRPTPEDARGPAERSAVESTFYVLPATARPAVLIASALAALRRPGRFFGAFGLAVRTSPPGPRALLWQLFYLAEALVLARHLSRAGVAHLHDHFGSSSCSVAMLASRLSGIPFSYTMHGPAELFDAAHWRHDEKIARSLFVACISHFCRSQAMLLSDQAHWPKLHIVHCGVDPARYDRGRGAPGKRLLFVGRLAAVKGVAVLIDAFVEVLRSHPEARLTLIGDGAERSALEALAKRRGVAERIEFAGFRSQDEVADALAEADLFVLPSFAEGVPVVLMEAMAARLPVVASRIAGVPELVEDGTSGLLVPPGDAAALATAVGTLLADPERRARMGQAGRARVLAEFDQATEAARLDGLFDGAGRGPVRPPVLPLAQEEAQKPDVSPGEQAKERRERDEQRERARQAP
jgi:glycosyltransferase involved in cell wall biosynthesis